MTSVLVAGGAGFVGSHREDLRHTDIERLVVVDWLSDQLRSEQRAGSNA